MTTLSMQEKLDTLLFWVKRGARNFTITVGEDCAFDVYITFQREGRPIDVDIWAYPTADEAWANLLEWYDAVYLVNKGVELRVS